jgi:anti-sigma-K factor RskA
MKQKRPKPIGLRSMEKDKARRKGFWRLVIVGICAAVITIAALAFLMTREITDTPADPNKAEKTPVKQPAGS